MLHVRLQSYGRYLCFQAASLYHFCSTLWLVRCSSLKFPQSSVFTETEAFATCFIVVYSCIGQLLWTGSSWQGAHYHWWCCFLVWLIACFCIPRIYLSTGLAADTQWMLIWIKELIQKRMCWHYFVWIWLTDAASWRYQTLHHFWLSCAVPLETLTWYNKNP